MIIHGEEDFDEEISKLEVVSKKLVEAMIAGERG